MAPVTRRRSSMASTENDDHDPQIRKARRQRPSPLKSAMRRRLRRPRRTQQVTFEIEDCDYMGKVHLPKSPHPGSRQMSEMSAEDFTPKAPIDHGKRREREELLKRATTLLEKSSTIRNDLPTPPPSTRDGRASTFDGSQKTPGGENAGRVKKLERSAKPKNSEPLPSKLDLVKLSSRHIDIVMDDIPDADVLQMPNTIGNILIEPSADIKMEEVCTAFDILKAQIQNHCREFYSYKKPANDHNFPPFTYLKVRHPELFRYIQYVADGSQYGWDKLISVGPQRENLVYGVISRALIAHIFDTELFGASAKHDEILLEMCRKYLNFDAFVRSTHRAEIIVSILQYGAKGGRMPGDDNHAYFSSAIQGLESRISLLLEPLRHQNEDAYPLQQSLLRILWTAVKVHLAIRLAGLNGTVYRFEHVRKNSHWDSTMMNCLNQRKMDLTVHHGEEHLVKVSCFPALYATVPSGPTLENFEEPDFVEEWKKTANEDGSKPVITTYPITLADVVLENTPHDRSGFLTLTQTMAKEQVSMSDEKFHKLTGINRARRNRIHRIAKRAPRAAAAAASFGLTAAAAVSWYLYNNTDSSNNNNKEEALQHLLPTQTPSWLISSSKAIEAAAAAAAAATAAPNIANAALSLRAATRKMMPLLTKLKAGAVAAAARITKTTPMVVNVVTVAPSPAAKTTPVR